MRAVNPQRPPLPMNRKIKTRNSFPPAVADICKCGSAGILAGSLWFNPHRNRNSMRFGLMFSMLILAGVHPGLIRAQSKNAKMSSEAEPISTAHLELSRPVRPWEFLPLTGTRAALFGNEAGQMEAWIYPLKLLRDFRLVFHEGDHAIPAEVLARTITVRPESATIVYSSDTFTVRETFFVPVKEQGALISFDIQTEQPLEIEARFVRDFQLEWPAAIGGTFIEWDKN